MISIKEGLNKKISDINVNNFYVVADFDKTITSKKSNTTFSLFSKSGFYPKSYLEERNRNYDYYRPLELDPKIDKKQKSSITKKWQTASYELMLKYNVKEKDIKRILNISGMLTLRDGAKDFIKLLNEKNIPLIISSAGIGNFIKELLILNDCYSNNIFINANMLEFKDGVIIDSIKDIIHSMNKNNIVLTEDFSDKIKDKDFAIIIGDQLSDLDMVSNLPFENSISFGFLESNINENRPLFKDSFDVVLENDASFDEISKILKIK